MSNTNNNATQTQVEDRAARDRRYAAAFLDLEVDICNMKTAAALNEMLLGHILKESDEEAFPAVASLKRAGYRVFLLTKNEEDILAYAIYQAGDLAREIDRKFQEA